MIIESKSVSFAEEDYDNSLISIHSNLKIFKEELPDGNVRYQKIGNALSYYFDVAHTINSEESIFDLFDIDGSFPEFYHLLYENGFFKEIIVDQMGDIINSNLFLIQKVEISPKFRGNNYGLAAVLRLIQQFAHGVGLVVLKPFPVQFENGQQNILGKKNNYKSFVKNEKQAFDKIKRYWEIVGFEQIGQSNIWGLNPLNKIKNVNEIEYENND